jgi:type IV secretion system protein VirB6
MDEAAPITWLVNEINAIVSSGAGATAGAIAKTVMPLVTIGFGIYILLILINYMRGAEDAPVIDFMLRIASFGVVVTLGLNANTYADVVLPIITGLGGDLADAVSGGTVGAGALDQLALHYLKIINGGLNYAESETGMSKISAYIYIFMKAIIIVVGLVPFLVAAAVAIIVANVGITIVAMLGPLFFAFLLFPATRQYFSAWLNTCFSYALIPFIVAVVATISVGISQNMLSSGGTLQETSFISVFLSSIGNLILLFVLKQVASLASSLSAGGINAAMPGGLGALAQGMRSAGKGSAEDIKSIGKAAGATWRGGVAVKNWGARKLGLGGNTIKPG